MKTILGIREMQDIAMTLRSNGKRIGVVPTMGYLHAGHLSLIEIAKKNADVVITTIFVNPTQFGPNEDFSKYPRDVERDTRLAQSAGSDYLFLPSTAEMYPGDYFTYVTVEGLTKVLEGSSRPGHFRGVTTVVAKLFNITQPDVAVFGQKDAQQSVVIQRMVKDLNFPVNVIIAPIVREDDGLAMSSRNAYLSPNERRQSTVLSKSLKLAEKLIREGERQPEIIIKEMKALVSQQNSAVIDYVAVTDPLTLEDLGTLRGEDRVLISLAVRIGKTRLIDNTIITVH